MINSVGNLGGSYPVIQSKKPENLSNVDNAICEEPSNLASAGVSLDSQGRAIIGLTSNKLNLNDNLSFDSGTCVSEINSGLDSSDEAKLDEAFNRQDIKFNPGSQQFKVVTKDKGQDKQTEYDAAIPSSMPKAEYIKLITHNNVKAFKMTGIHNGNQEVNNFAQLSEDGTLIVGSNNGIYKYSDISNETFSKLVDKTLNSMKDIENFTYWS